MCSIDVVVVVILKEFGGGGGLLYKESMGSWISDLLGLGRLRFCYHAL